MNFTHTIKKITNTLNESPVEPYTIIKTNPKTGEEKEISIVPVISGPYVSEMNQYY